MSYRFAAVNSMYVYDQILRHERGQGNIHFPVQLTTCRTGNLTRLIHSLAICVTIRICMVITCRKSKDQPGKDTIPAHGQLNR